MLRDLADKFFWAIIGLFVLVAGFFITNVISTITSANIENWAESQGIDTALVRAWPSIVGWVIEHSILLSMATSFLAGSAVALVTYRRLAPIDRPNLRDPDGVAKFGRECAALVGEMTRFLERRKIENSQRRGAIRLSGTVQSVEGQWEAERDFDEVTKAMFFGQYGPRALHALSEMARRGVVLAPHVLSITSSGRPDDVVKLLGVLSEYLKEAKLEEAIELANDDNRLWLLIH